MEVARYESVNHAISTFRIFHRSFRGAVVLIKQARRLTYYWGGGGGGGAVAYPGG